MYTSLSSQMEQYFAEITKQEGYTDFEKEAWSFKVHITFMLLLAKLMIISARSPECRASHR
jgi:hypothetical protein